MDFGFVRSAKKHLRINFIYEYGGSDTVGRFHNLTFLIGRKTYRDCNPAHHILEIKGIIEIIYKEIQG